MQRREGGKAAERDGGKELGKEGGRREGEWMGRRGREHGRSTGLRWWAQCARGACAVSARCACTQSIDIELLKTRSDARIMRAF